MTLQRNPAVLFQPVADGAILLHTQQEVYFGLNEVGAHIWQLLPVCCTNLKPVVDSLAQRYPEVEPAVLQADIAELLESLTNEGLIQKTPAT